MTILPANTLRRGRSAGRICPPASAHGVGLPGSSQARGRPTARAGGSRG